MNMLRRSWWMNYRKWFRVLGVLLLLAALGLAVRLVRANIFPDYLKNGRTYDQETGYIQWNGSVSFINLFHRDNTSLPASEGGGSCNSGCTEQVTRIQGGSSISGNFTYLQTFNVQAAYSGDPNVGTVTIRACGQTIRTENLYIANQGTPGFNNLPSPAWNVPTAGDCTWSISASGGYVDFRAVTTVYRTTPAPTVDLRVNGSNGPLNLGAPGSYTLSWTSTNAASCTASGSWSGSQQTNGSQVYSGIGAGTYTYAITCTNPSGSASDNVTVNVLPPPTVSVSAPAAMTAPASYTATWTSTNASSCTGSNRFNGISGLSGSKAESGLAVGSYDYTVTCTNAVGVQASDTKRTTVYAAPSVDVKVDGSDGPTVTRTGPISFSATWSSSNAASCSGASRLAGYSGLNGTRSENNVPAGTTYDYTVICQNAAGTTASDTVRIVVVSAPTVDVKVNGSDGPLSFIEPAGFTVSWSSANASSCTALNNLTGPIGANGSRALSSVLQGTYQYTVQCSNGAGTTVSDTVVVTVNQPPPVVDLKIEGGDGPITQVAPASFNLSWTSQYAATCTAISLDSLWIGNTALTGSTQITGALVGTHTYTLSCSNGSGTTSDTVTADVIAPLTGTITPAYAKLLLNPSILGQPAQSLSGSVSGGSPGYTIAIHILAPSGVETTYSRTGNTWSLSPTDAGIADFGSTEKGTWTTWAVLTDSANRTYRTPSAIWEVAWYPVHGRP